MPRLIRHRPPSWKRAHFVRKKRLLDTKLQSALGAASKRTSIDEQTVGELEAAVTSNADREALKAFLAANGDRFEAGAKVRFEKLVATMPPPARAIAP